MCSFSLTETVDSNEPGLHHETAASGLEGSVTAVHPRLSRAQIRHQDRQLGLPGLPMVDEARVEIF